MYKLLLIAAICLFSFRNTSFAQAPALGAASSFALFTAAGAFNGDAATSIVGDIGTNVGAYTPPGFLVGNVHLADPVSAQAAADVAIAYGYLAGLTCGSVLAATLGNSQTLSPNIYCIGSAAVLNANLILDGGGMPGAIFVFQIDGALSTNPFSSITLINGANLCNVYWQINGAFNEGGSTAFRGTVIAAGAINLAFGATLSGRGLSTAGAISTSANVITLPAACNCTLDITCPSANGGTFQCISQIPTGSAANVTVNSSCGTATVTISNTSTGTGCPASPYILTRTYLVTDTQGNTASCVVTYTAVDNIAPTISCPAAATVSCASLVPAVSTTSVVVGPDNCGGAPTVTFVSDVISNQTCANRFTITRTYRVTDACGNSATCSQTITVADNTAPTITCPGNLSVTCANQVPAGSNTAVVVGPDNCGGTTPTVTFSDAITNQTCANRFTLTRTYQVSDACGNTATCAQTIFVTDNTAPTITCPGNLSVTCANQ
ncbi:MAG: ice-binding family protein, partial [Saprospiraceae bacterium]